MNETHQAAVRAGAVTGEDFLLFDGLTSLRDQFREMHGTGGGPPVEEIVRLYDHYLELGRFFRPQHLPPGYRRGQPNQCYGNAFDLAVRTAGLTPREKPSPTRRIAQVSRPPGRYTDSRYSAAKPTDGKHQKTADLPACESHLPGVPTLHQPPRPRPEVAGSG